MIRKQEEKTYAEIAVVGWRYGDLSHVMKPIFDKKESVEPKDIKGILGDDRVILMLADSPHDKYAVTVSTPDMQAIGNVWMYQAPAVYRWLKHKRRKYLKGRVRRICAKAGVLMVVPELEVDMTDIERNSKPFDMEWASNLPMERVSKMEHNLCVSLQMLNEEISAHPSWNKELQHRIDALIELLPYDLSAHHYKEGLGLYNTMMQSDDSLMRLQSEIILSSFVHRGSSEQMEWWTEEWLPGYFKEAEKTSLLKAFEEEGYTLEKVEQLLSNAPEHLFTMYKTNKLQFAPHLYYSALPLKIYNRLLTLLAVREMMQKGRETENKEAAEKEETATDAEVPGSAEEELNYFAPTMALKKMLTGKWFTQFRTDCKYNKVWIKRFVDDLMASECKEEIARTWKQSSKRTTLKGNILGALKYAGVIAGSDLCIAAAVSAGSKDRSIKTFACYIGKGKKSKFRDWICSYINK